METKAHIENEVGFWILSTGVWWERVANEVLSDYGITYKQVQILGALLFLGEMAQGELAEEIRVEPSTIVRIVDRMERDGWIVRVPDPNDRRRKCLRTTEQVGEIWERILEAGHQVRERATAGMSPEQVTAVIEGLKLIRSNLEPPRAATDG